MALNAKLWRELAREGAKKRLVDYARGIQDLIREFPELERELEQIVPGVGYVPLVNGHATVTAPAPPVATPPAEDLALVPTLGRPPKQARTPEQRARMAGAIRKRWLNATPAQRARWKEIASKAGKARWASHPKRKET